MKSCIIQYSHIIDQIEVMFTTKLMFTIQHYIVRGGLEYKKKKKKKKKNSPSIYKKIKNIKKFL